MPPSPHPSSTTSTSRSPSPSNLKPKSKTTSKPRKTLYDATTSRLTTYTSLHAPSAHASTLHRDVLEHNTLGALTPGEALFEHHRGAPQRFEEADIYDAVGGLPAGARGEGVLRRGVVDWGRGGVAWDGDDAGVEKEEEREKKMLPTSEMLGAVHAYASDFYGALGLRGVSARREDKRKKKAKKKKKTKQQSNRDFHDHDEEVENTRWDFRSMDETALLAFGVLLEESVRAALGEEGDMVFVEGEAQGLDERVGRARSKSRVVPGGKGGHVDAAAEEEDLAVQRKQKQGKKRVRIFEASGTDEEAEGRMDRRRKKKRRRTVFEGEEDY